MVFPFLEDHLKDWRCWLSFCQKQRVQLHSNCSPSIFLLFHFELSRQSSSIGNNLSRCVTVAFAWSCSEADAKLILDEVLKDLWWFKRNPSYSPIRIREFSSVPFHEMFIAKNKVDFLASQFFIFAIFRKNTPHSCLSTYRKPPILYWEKLSYFWSHVRSKPRADLGWNKSLSNSFSTAPYAYMNYLMPSCTEPLSLRWTVETFSSINFTQSVRGHLRVLPCISQ